MAAFTLGNFTIDEIITGVAQDKSDDTIMYTLDQLSSAQIEISADSNDITDKNGNIVRTIYRNKQGTFTATNAFLHPQVLNAQSGTELKKASSGATIAMPSIATYTAGSVVTLPAEYVTDSLRVIGVYGSGGNSGAMTAASVSGSAGFDTETGTGTYKLVGNTLTLPAAADNAPVNYVVKYSKNASSGYAIVNKSDTFGATVKMTFSVAIVDPCTSNLRSAYLVLPSFQPSPETTISLSSDEQELDFTGILQTDYCGSEKILYQIYFPDEDAVVTAIDAGATGATGATGNN